MCRYTWERMRGWITAFLKKDVEKNVRVDDDARMTKMKLMQAVSKRTGIDAATVRAVMGYRR